jgi:hypothetical protein
MADAFDQALGTRRGLGVDDTIAAREPTDRAQDELQALLRGRVWPNRPSWAMDEVSFETLATLLDAHRGALLEGRPLLRRLLWHLAEDALIRERQAWEPACREILFALSQWRGEAVAQNRARSRAAALFCFGNDAIGARALDGGPIGERLRAEARAETAAHLPGLLGRAIMSQGLRESLICASPGLNTRGDGSWATRAAATLGPEDAEAMGQALLEAQRGVPEGEAGSHALRTALRGIARERYDLIVKARLERERERASEAEDFMCAECAHAAEAMAALGAGVDAASLAQEMARLRPQPAGAMR